MLTAEEAARLHPAPPVTASKIQRLRLLAERPEPEDPRERRVELPHARSTSPSVSPAIPTRACAPASPATRRRRATCCASSSRDASEAVRGWVAVNFYVPADVMDALADDESETVRALVAWKAHSRPIAPELALAADRGGQLLVESR